jgi:uncharacterized membrane protein YkoI
MSIGKEKLAAILIALGFATGGAIAFGANAAPFHSSGLTTAGYQASPAATVCADDGQDENESDAPDANEPEGDVEDQQGDVNENENDQPDANESEGQAEDQHDDQGVMANGSPEPEDGECDDSAPATPGALDDGADLLPQAKISVDQAIAAAQAAATGDLGEVDLEYRDNVLVFSVDIGTSEVKIDAATGTVIAIVPAEE